MSRSDDPALCWRHLHSEPPVDYAVFRVARHVAEHPDTAAKRSFSVLDAPNWVNVVALTPDEHVVCVRQFRHGTREVTLEIPGGMVDPGESPIEAARRELREETGYVAEELREIGWVEPNPAIQNNRCYTFLARGDFGAEGPAPDAGEVLRVELHRLSEVPRLIADGDIRHALVVAAFFHFARTRSDFFSIR